MDSLIQKYMDGDLTDEESSRFLEELAANDNIQREVAALEEIVDLGSRLKTSSTSTGFADRVMKEVGFLERPGNVQAKSSSGSLFRRRSIVPLAASWILALGLGYILSEGMVARQSDSMGPNGDGQASLAAVSPGTTSAPGLKVVRLVYSPPQADVSRVRVAGSFNNWDPNKTPMWLENGRWVTSLILPPDNYEYMFVVDDDTWVTDPNALTTRDDGFGSRNAVLELSL